MAVRRGRSAFGPYLNASNDSFLFRVLGHITERRPWNYWDRDVYRLALATLRAEPVRALQSLDTHRHEIDIGMKAWLRFVPAFEDERPISFPDTNDLIRIETLHHPEYLRRAELIFGRVIHLYWGVLKKNGTDGGFDLRSALAVLRSKGCAILASGFRDEMRNGIAHGQVVFTEHAVRYGPASHAVELLPSDLLHEMDRLWMTCNSLVLAMTTFAGEHLTDLGTAFTPPSRLAVLFAEVTAGHPGFSVLEVVTSDYPQTGRQLHLSLRSSLLSRAAVIANCASIALAVWSFGARGYQRLICDVAHPGKRISSTLIILPSKLASLSQHNSSLEQLVEAFCDPVLLWYDECRLSLRIKSFRILFKSGLLLMRAEFADYLRAAGFRLPRSRYIVRSVDDRSVGQCIRLEVTAVLVDENDADDKHLLREIAYCIISDTRRQLHWSRPDGLSRTIPRFGRPKHIWVKLFRRDSTVREFGHGGWHGMNLVLVAEMVFGFRRHLVLVPNAQEVWRGVHLRYGLDNEAWESAITDGRNTSADLPQEPLE